MGSDKVDNIEQMAVTILQNVIDNKVSYEDFKVWSKNGHEIMSWLRWKITMGGY